MLGAPLTVGSMELGAGASFTRDKLWAVTFRDEQRGPGFVTVEIIS